MTQRPPLYDGSIRIKGVWGAQHSLDIAPRGFCPDAINRTFRHGGCGRTRPRIERPDLVFESDEEADLFHRGSIQGGIGYRRTTQFRAPGIVLASSGRVWFGRVGGQTIFLRRIYSDLSPDVTHVWFCQAEERVYAQDGISRPMGWSGNENDPAYIIPEVEDGEQMMPIGQVMAFAHGRILVASKSGQIAASDHISGDADRRNAERFTENTAFFGGTFSMPSVLGQLVSIQVQPAQESRTYHGAVVVLCENGAASLDISGPRFEVDGNFQPTGLPAWQDAKVLYVGPGFASHWGVVPVNNDLWARRVDGIQTLQVAYQRESRGWSDPVLSRPVQHYLSFDSSHLLQFIPAGYLDNRVFFGVMPIAERGEMGIHRYCRAMVVADTLGAADQDGELNWEGLWTGPSPILFCSTGDPSERMFIISRSNGMNEVYEQTANFGSDPDSRKIESSLTCPYYEFASDKGGGRFATKEFVGGGRTRLIARGAAAYSSRYRSNDEHCWHDLTGEIEIGTPPRVSLCPTPPISYSTITISQDSPMPECGGEQAPSNHGLYFQMQHRFRGDVDLIGCRVKALLAQGDPEIAECDVRDFADDPDCCTPDQLLEYRYGADS